MSKPELDDDVVSALASDIGLVVKAHFEKRPRSKLTVFEILNALACNAAVIIQGTKFNEEVMRFFADALSGEVNDLMQSHEVH